MDSTLASRYPELLPVPDWLSARQRFVFLTERQIGSLTVDEAAELGADIVTGATNAGYIGFMGGPYVWDGKDTIYNMWTDEPVDRSYFDVILEPGRPALIYRESSGDWFMHA